MVVVSEMKTKKWYSSITGTKRTYVIVAGSPEESKAWQDAIQGAVDSYRPKAPEVADVAPAAEAADVSRAG